MQAYKDKIKVVIKMPKLQKQKAEKDPVMILTTYLAKPIKKHRMVRKRIKKKSLTSTNDQPTTD